VFLQKDDKLSLEIAFPMMLGLVCDIGECRVYLAPSDGECPVAFLPGKAFYGGGFLHPMRGCTLDFAHSVGNRQCRRKRQQHVDVILDSADRKSFHIVFPRNSAHVSPEPRLDFRCDGFASVLCREDAMKQGATIGV
jgi:hypothetical protein